MPASVRPPPCARDRSPLARLVQRTHLSAPPRTCATQSTFGPGEAGCASYGAFHEALGLWMNGKILSVAVVLFVIAAGARAAVNMPPGLLLLHV